MSNRRRLAAILVESLLPLTLIACVDDPASTLTPGASLPSRSVANLPDEAVFEAPHMLGIARELPAFGGFYYNDRGQLEVALTDESYFADAVTRIRAILPAQMASTASFVSRPVQYSFMDLARYRTVLRDRVFAISGVVSIGVSESQNRVKIGVTQPAAEYEVRAVVDSLRIPRESVTFEYGSVGSSSHITLRMHNPTSTIQGGWQVATASPTKVSTLGFAALRRSDASEVFVVNSHATNVPHEYDGGWMGQPYLTGQDTIGQEILDPPTWTCGSDQCRHSDSALFRATKTLDLGRIARTTVRCGLETCDTTNVTVDDTYPTILIVSRRDYNIENETLDKIGRSTGWTYGAVEDTCHDYKTSGWIKLCSDRVDYSSEDGDSGSPVFSYNGGVGGSAELRGIHWGWWDCFLCGKDGLMSDLYQIEQDLGGLVVYDPGPPSVSIDGPLEVRTNLLCTWTALITGGIPPFTYTWTGIFTGDSQSIDRVATTSGWLYVDIVDWKGRTSSSMEYITVTPDGPIPPGCTE